MKIICQIGVHLCRVLVSSSLSGAASSIPGQRDRHAAAAGAVGHRAAQIEHIREKADFLLANMAFFFLPAGVSVINYFDVLGRSAVALVLVCLLSTVITFGATALSIRFTLRLLERRKSRV